MLSDREYMRPGQHERRGWHWPHSAVVTLIFITVGITAIAALLNLNGDLSLSRSDLHGAGWLRLLSSAFVHFGVLHLLLNMVGLYVFGKDVEPLLGSRRFVIMYLLSALAGGLAFAACDPTHAVLGASGAVFGVTAAALLLIPNQRMMLLLPPVPLKMRTLVLVYLALEIIFLVTGTATGISHVAHLGGFVAGYAYVRLVLWQRHGFAWPRWMNRNRPSRAPAGWSILDETTRPPATPPPPRRDPPPAPPPRREPRVTPVLALGDDEISREIDPILDKIGQSGMASLTRRERDILDRARERLKGSR